MKTKLIFIVIILSLNLNAFTQDFYGGLMGGFNGSQVEGDATSGYHKLGLAGGVWTQRDLNNDLFWSMELRLNQKGMRIRPTLQNGNYSAVYRLNYVEIPVLLGYRALDYLSVIGGFAYGYLFNSSGHDVYGPITPQAYQDISNWEFSGFLGVKVDLEHLVNRHWASKFMLETKMQLSLLSIDREHAFITEYFNYHNQYNNLLSTVLYYQIEWNQ